MSEQSQQGFVDPPVDYRHTQLMNEVAQRIAPRSARTHKLHDRLAKHWSRHTSCELPPCPMPSG
jgi:hypothetical protein